MPKAEAKNKPRVKDERVKLRVLLKNKRMCCICHSRASIQLHHIDGNRSNTTEANLVVLCLTHHDQATAGLRKGQVGLGVKLSPTEVRAHKAAWETAVAGELRTTRKVVSQLKRKQLEVLFEFELIKAKNEIFSASTQEFVKKRLSFLTEFVVEEFVSGIPYRKMLVEALSDIAARSAGDEKISLPLIAAVRDLHPHLIGPQDVPMRGADKAALVKSGEILEIVGEYGVYLSRNDRIVREACRALIELADIASWYRFSRFAARAKQALQRMQKEHSALSSQEKQRQSSKVKLRLIKRALKSLRNGPK